MGVGLQVFTMTRALQANAVLFDLGERVFFNNSEKPITHCTHLEETHNRGEVVNCFPL